MTQREQELKDLEDVKEYREDLKYVKDPTPDVCLEAAMNSWKDLKYVKDQT